MLASAYKRKAILCKGEKQKAALKAAAFNYREAWKIAAGFYAYTSWIQIAGLLVHKGDHKWGEKVTVGKENYTLPSFNAIDVELAQHLAATTATSQVLDYWDWVARANIMLCSLVIHPEHANDAVYCREITTIFQKVWARAGSPYKRKSEEDQFAFLIEMLADCEGCESQISSIEKIISTMKG